LLTIAGFFLFEKIKIKNPRQRLEIYFLKPGQVGYLNICDFSLILNMSKQAL